MSSRRRQIYINALVWNSPPAFHPPASKKITAELNSIPAEMEKLDQEIGRAELLAAERLIERLGAEAKVGACLEIMRGTQLSSDFHCMVLINLSMKAV